MGRKPPDYTVHSLIAYIGGPAGFWKTVIGLPLYLTSPKPTTFADSIRQASKFIQAVRVINAFEEKI